MEMVFLILWASPNHAAVVMPQPYPKSQCEQISKVLSLSVSVQCIPAPLNNDDYYNCQILISDPSNPSRGMVAKSHCEPSVGSVKGNKDNK